MENKTGGNTPVKNDSNQDVTPAFQLIELPRLAVTAANIGIWFLDEQTGTFLVSTRMKELHGYSPDEEMSFEDALMQIPDQYRQKAIRTMKEAASKQEPFYMEYPVLGFHDQQQRWLRVMGGGEQQVEGIKRFSGVAMDITEQKQNELRKNKFIGMVSHELKTPLTALKAYIQLLSKWARQKKDNFSIGALSKLEKQVKKMTLMINGFLNFSGVESGRIHLNKQDFSLNELVNEVIEENRAISPDHSIILLPSKEIRVHADREKIEQVIINLINNAIKYSDKGMPIEISLQQEEGVKLSVKDTGMGIDKNDIAKLFKPHSRIKTTKTEKISGFGIGLYLCAEIIKYHGGQIGVESEAGVGSIFWFTLPTQGVE